MSDTKSHYTAVGRRKTAVAKIKISPGTGVVYVNDKPGDLYFQYNSQYIGNLKAPLVALGLDNNYNVLIEAKGGGLKGQNDAAKLGVSRALCLLSDTQRPVLKKYGFLTRDYRAKERKKYGLRKARKAPQFSKR